MAAKAQSDAGLQQNLRRTYKRANSERYSPAMEAPSMKTKRISTVDAAEASSSKRVSIAVLPPEMLEVILHKVSSSDLINCRQMNRSWNEISSHIMRQRADVELQFSFYKGNYGPYKDRFMHKVERRYPCTMNICDEPYTYTRYDEQYKHTSKSLTDFVVCLSKSKHFPYTSFRFDDLANFETEEMEGFLSVWGKNILALNVSIDDPVSNIGILRDVLRKKAPNLKRIKVQFCRNVNNFWENFPSSTSSIELFGSSHKFQLCKLETFCVNDRYRKFHRIVENILEAACNLKKFEINKRSWMEKQPMLYIYEKVMIDPEESIAIEDLAMLQASNKLHCLKNVRMIVSKDLVAYWLNSIKSVDIKLESLALSLHPSIWEDKLLKFNATVMVNQLFDSSKNVLQTLAIQYLGSLPGLLIPKLVNLKRLDLWRFPGTELTTASIFPLFQMADVFPNLKELELHYNCFHPLQLFKNITSVNILRIFGVAFAEKLMKATTNVKTLIIIEDTDFWTNSDQSNWNMTKKFRVISNNLTKLENFGWVISRSTHHDLLYSLDAIMTGIPTPFCKKMLEKIRYESRASKELKSYKRTYSSILDLKELKKFDVHLIFDKESYWARNEAEVYVHNDISDTYQKNEIGFNVNNKFYKTGFTKGVNPLNF